MAKYNRKIVKKSKLVTIRFTPLEKETLKRKASYCYTTLANYIRVVSLNNELPTPTQLTEEQFNSLNELKNILQNKMRKSSNLFSKKDPGFAEEIRLAVSAIQKFLEENGL